LSSCDGARILTISGHRTYPTNGHLYLTDVGVIGGPGHSISLGRALRGWLDHDVAVLPQDVIFPPSQSAQQTQQQNTQEMTDSQHDAKVAALNALHLLPAEIAIAGFIPHSPAEAAGIAKGDVITSINGRRVTSVADLTSLVGRHAIGDTVQVGYRHGGAAHTVPVRLVASPQAPSQGILGVHPASRATGKLPFRINIGLENVTGPSAGLMFALGIIDKLSKKSLTGGLSVAGTGTIAADGTVGEIGGVEQKIIGARKLAGATVFLSPAANCADAKAAAPAGIRVVKVTTLQDALSALSALRGGPGVVHPC
jgi:PDZ domain-containing protein